MDDRTWDTMTRTDLLEARGYDPAVVAGNGHALAPVREDAGGAPPGVEASRRCARPGCDNPLKREQRTYCSVSCQRASAVPPTQRPKAAAQVKPGGEIRHAVTELPAGGGVGVGALLAVMAQLPAEVEAIELVGGWKLTRRR